MAEVINFLVFLVIFHSGLIGTVHTKDVHYGPSISSLTSSQQNRTTGGISRKIHKVLLEDFPNYSVVIPLLTGKPYGFSSEIMQERGTVKTGQFAVQAPKGYGVMAVIQELDLPVETIDYVGLFGLNIKNKCTDFVQFKESKSIKTKEICGKVNKDNLEAKPNDLTGPRSFNSSNGKIVVSFQHGDISDFPFVNTGMINIQDQGNNKPETTGYLYKLEIVFTAYSSCGDQSKSTDGNLIPCESTDVQDNDTCINANLFCNEYINCGIPSQFASDEINCPYLQNSSIGEIGFGPLRTERNNLSRLDSISSILSHFWNPLKAKENTETKRVGVPQFYPELKYEVVNPQRNGEGSSFLRNDDSMFDPTDLHITPTGVILLIILTIATVMILSVVVRFCCYRCVGKSPENPTQSTNVFNYGATGVPTTNNPPTPRTQSSFGRYSDTPPAYEELFPPFLYKSERNASPSSIPVAVLPQYEENQNGNRLNSSDGSIQTQNDRIKTTDR